MRAPDHTSEDARLIVVGRIGRSHGVAGWCHVHSWTRPAENIGNFPAWRIGRDGRWEADCLVPCRFEAHGKGFIACFVGISGREAAQRLVGMDVAVARSALPPPDPDEFYWIDLIGLEVYSGGRCLGRVERLFETGSNDVMVVQGDRERLVPFVLDRFVRRVDLARGRIDVDWDPEF